MATAFTNAGTSIVAKRMLQTGTAPKYMDWGTGTTAAAVGDTALQTAQTPSGGRTAGTESQVTVTNTGDTYQVTGTLTATTAAAYTEYGQFDASTAGNMLIHSVFAAYNLAVNDSITFTSQLKFVPQVV